MKLNEKLTILALLLVTLKLICSTAVDIQKLFKESHKATIQTETITPSGLPPNLEEIIEIKETK